jgi:5'-phosphate synthase pdxT subunit
VVASAKVGILALQGDVGEHAQALAELGAEPVEVRRPHHLGGVDAIVLPGGESTTISKLLETSDLFEPLAERLGAGMPAFGTCAGMILLATDVLDGRADQRSFGAVDLAVRRNAFGRQVDSFEREVTLRLEAGARPVALAGREPAQPREGDEAPFHAVFIRAPWVAQAGSDVGVIAEDNGRIVAVRQGPLLATAFHPELTPDRRVHELFVEMVKGTS